MLSKQELRGPFRNILELLLASYTGLGMHASAKETQTVSMMGVGGKLLSKISKPIIFTVLP